MDSTYACRSRVSRGGVERGIRTKLDLPEILKLESLTEFVDQLPHMPDDGVAGVGVPAIVWHIRPIRRLSRFSCDIGQRAPDREDVRRAADVGFIDRCGPSRRNENAVRTK